MLGSDRRWRNDWNGFISSVSTVAPARSSVTGAPRTLTVRPWAKASTSAIVAALPSTAPRATASSASEERASRTVATAHSTLRPRSRAIAVIFATASLSTFSPIVPAISSPCPPTGEAAPMFVPGAIRAMCPASVMKVPAEAARPPEGETQTITGRGASRKVPTIWFVDSSEPPGVSSWTMTVAAPRSPAAATPSRR